MFVTFIKQNIKTSTTNFRVNFPIRAISGSINGEKIIHHLSKHNLAYERQYNLCFDP